LSIDSVLVVDELLTAKSGLLSKEDIVQERRKTGPITMSDPESESSKALTAARVESPLQTPVNG